MFWKLPPVRRPAIFSNESQQIPLEKLTGRYVQFLGSGTQALAAALLACKRARPRASEVVLPAYACPDLISAALFAKLTPRLVDLVDDGSWAVNMTQLRDNLSDATAAIVAVNLFGLGDDANRLADVAQQHGVPLVQDSAQALSSVTAQHWIAPYVILSFGRGKPLNMLGGGALLTRHQLHCDDGAMSSQSSIREAVFQGAAAAAAFNLVTHPRAYWLASQLPGLGVGATVFRPLEALERPGARRRLRFAQLLGAKLSVVPNEVDWTETSRRWSRFGIQLVSQAPQDRFGLLRFPVLAASENQRDEIVRRLTHVGGGISTMYGTALNQRPDVPQLVRSQGPFPNAASFARRLFTLPTHSFVDHQMMTKVDREMHKLRTT